MQNNLNLLVLFAHLFVPFTHGEKVLPFEKAKNILLFAHLFVPLQPK
jgi:hypothetical protein